MGVVYSSGELCPHIRWQCFKDGVEDVVSSFTVVQDKVQYVFVFEMLFNTDTPNLTASASDN